MWSAGFIIPIHRLVDRVLDLYGPLPILNTLCTAAALKRGSRGSIIAQFHSTGEFFIRVSRRSEPQEQGGKEPLGPLDPLGPLGPPTWSAWSCKETLGPAGGKQEGQFNQILAER